MPGSVNETALAACHRCLNRGCPAGGLPAGLAAACSGDLGFTEPCLYANFVASLDGVTALGPEYPSSGSAISGREPADPRPWPEAALRAAENGGYQILIRGCAKWVMARPSRPCREKGSSGSAALSQRDPNTDATDGTSSGAPSAPRRSRARR